MDKTVAGLIGAVTLLAAADPALAAMPAPTGLKAAMQAESYADLLKPIPDAVTLLKESDEAAAKADLAKAELLPAASEGEATVQEAQYYYHHHHHHHHRFYRRFYHHHHHHQRFFRRYHHHHHHGYFRPYGY